MQAQARRVYQITFCGCDKNGVLPMFLRVKAETAKEAVKEFIRRYQPVSGWLMGDPEDITGRVISENEEGKSEYAEMKKAG